MDGTNGVLLTPPYSPLVTRLLHTNSTPSFLQEQEICAYLRAEERNLQALEEEISQLKVLRLKSRKYLQDHRVTLSSVRRIPVEIIGEIVLWACQVDEDHKPRYAPRNFRVESNPWKYTHISSLWRSVTTGLSVLWSDFTLHSSSFPPQRSDTLDSLQVILARSGNMRLRFTYGAFDTCDIRLFETLLAESRRWEMANLSLPQSWLGSLHILTGSLPLLESFKLSIRDDSWEEEELGTLEGDWLAHAPMLHELKLYDCGPGPQNSFIIPWNQLTEFTCTEPSSAVEELEMLRRLPMLSTYTSTGWTHAAPVGDLSPVTLPHLRKLTVVDGSSTQVLSQIHAPTLQSIEWHMTDHFQAVEIAPALSTLLLRASDSVTDFYFYVAENCSDDDDPTWQAITDVLGHCKNLTTLSAKTTMSKLDQLEQQILPLLVLKKSSGILSALTSLSIILDDYVEEDLDYDLEPISYLLHAIFRSRRRRGQLKAFSLTVTCPDDLPSLPTTAFTRRMMEDLTQAFPDMDISFYDMMYAPDL